MIEASHSTLMENQPINWTFPTLTTIIVVVLLAWLAKFHWGRRNLYKLASKIPGPPSYPLIGSGYMFIGDTSEIFEKMQKILDFYPELSKIWFGHRLFFIISKPEHLEIILNSAQCLEKDSLYKLARQVVGTGLFSASVHQWKKNRKLISPAFNQKILDSFVSIFAEQTRVFIKILEKKEGIDNLDIFRLTSAFSLDSLCESAMGIKVEAQLSSSGLSEWIDKIMMIVFIRMAVLWYNFDIIFNFTKLSKTLRQSITNMHQFTQKVVKEKRELFELKLHKLRTGEEIEEEGKRKTFLELLFQLSHEGAKMTDEELRQEVDTFTIAGTDTTASSLCFCFVMLGMHQEMQQKILEEVLDILGEDRDVTAEDLTRMTYLERFIKETLRLFPVGPLILRTAENDVNIGECVIPAGCSIALGIFRVQRNEKYWHNPLKFDPDRFLPEEVAKRHPYCYLPFAGGPRNCIGSKYAMMSMKSMLAMVVRKFLIKTDYKSVEEIKLKANIVLRPTDGFKLSVYLRQ